MSSYAHYINTAWPSSLDSLEGVPDIFEPRVRPEERGTVGRWVHDALDGLGGVLPGVGLAVALAWAGYILSEAIGQRLHFDKGKSPLSPITVAVVLGLIIRNTVGVPKNYEQGLRFCIKSVLRLGIVILGLTLSVKAIGRDVIAGLPVVVICIATALIIVTYVNRALGLSRRLGTLIAVGTSICGVSAIVATAPVIDAEEDETSYAVACITVFGLIALIAYPFLAHALFGDHQKMAGIFLGTSIHDTSQVTGAGLAYAQQYKADVAMKTAVTVKLVRNLCMSILIPLMAILYRRGDKSAGRKIKQPWHQIIPLFVVGFVLMACVRSLGDAGGGAYALGIIPRDKWALLDPNAKFYVSWLLATALGAVGLGTGFAKLKGLGWKPFSVGFAAALLVGCVSTLLIKVLAQIGVIT
jgi:uncharacterized integral membrane protein (TIGR00698 family)